ncbi:MAG: hypothetical protein MJZ18_06575 [Bacteroidales bacterium]|nr:hypothetical protein [Bacteroidales bacterium]
MQPLWIHIFRLLTIAIFIWAIPQQTIAQIEDNAYQNNDTTYYDSYDDDSYYDDSYDDYTEEYHWEIPCEHAGNETYWKTLTYKGSMENYNKPAGTEGHVRISDSCIDIDCTAMRMYFGIGSHIRITPELYRVFRDRADEIFDVIEIRKGFGPHKGKIILFIGQWTDDGHLRNTVQLICIPVRVNGKRQFELPKEKRAWISPIEQVR